MSDKGDLFGDGASSSEGSIQNEEQDMTVEQDIVQQPHDEVSSLSTVAVAFPDPNVLPINQVFSTMRLPPSIVIAEKEYVAGDEIGQDASVHVIRWRYKRDASGNIINNPNTGKPDYESNSRIIKWSDGTSSLVVGDAYYDIQSTQDRVHLFTSVGGDDASYDHASAPQELADVIGTRLVIRRVQTAMDVEAAGKNLKNARAQRGVAITTTKATTKIVNPANLNSGDAVRTSNGRTDNLSAAAIDEDDDDDDTGNHLFRS